MKTKGYNALLVKTEMLLTRLLLRPKIYSQFPDKDPLPLPEPCIIISNHTAYLDAPVIITTLRRHMIYPIAAKDHITEFWFGLLMRHYPCIPINRNNPTDLTWLHQSLDVLKNDGGNVLIFPEGHRSKTSRRLQPFHSGTVMLAALAQVPLVMIYIDGPHCLFFKRSRLIVSEPFRLPPPPAGLTPEYVRQQTEQLERQMHSLMNQFLASK